MVRGDVTVRPSGNTIRLQEIFGTVHHQAITAGRDGVPEVLPIRFTFQFQFFRPEIINSQLQFPLGKMKGVVSAPGMFQLSCWGNMNRYSLGISIFKIMLFGNINLSRLATVFWRFASTYEDEANLLPNEFCQ